MKEKIRVSIIGGGIAGIALAANLVKFSHLQIEIFEAAPEFLEIGAGISFGKNAVSAIEKLGLAEEYRSIADTVKPPFHDIWFQWRDGLTDKYLSNSIALGVGQSSVHRAHFLEIMVQKVPKVNCHFNKRLQQIKESDDEVTLTFMDGTSFNCDYVIGADGIRSVVRDYVLSSHNEPLVQPRFSGTWAYRGIIKYQEFRDLIIKHALAIEIADVPQMFLAKDSHILTFPIGKGELINIVAFKSDRSNIQLDENTPWTKPVEKSQMMEDFKGWSESCQLLLSLIDKPTIWALHELAELNQYISHSKRIIIMGDAAHAMVPHQGAGAGQGLEDALILAQLLKYPSLEMSDLPEVSEIYQKLRLERACKVQRTSRESGEIYELYSNEYPTLEAVGEHLKTRFDWLWEYDLNQDIQFIKNRFEKTSLV
ncbi:salicylate 1-monooxygenase [Acinetobacter lactucae]|uniref:salicylate 1-monooxygenase n=1 Tax=Acinetobacter lactucae TaxID=1785128 RepID=UPI0021CD40E8|nr:salicylate 1-monooxygenase [Acinetobacter lactucae]MCU4347716.1 salicylate 1-monooxygenase [Acinetobacter lactucae]